MQIIMKFICLLYISLTSLSLIETQEVTESADILLEGLFPFHQKEKIQSEGTFRGTEYLSYDFQNSEPIISSGDEISLYFKTRQANGLLFYTGDGQGDYLILAVRDGGIVLTVKIGSATLEKLVKPTKVRFDDNQWHKVLVHRKVTEITRATSFCHFSITVDGIYTERGSTAGSFSLLSSSILYVGGSDHTDRLPGSRLQSNFVGCLRKVEFTTDNLKLDILEMGRNGTNLIKQSGNLPYMCQEVEAADPVTFTTRDSFLELPTWESARAGTLSLKIRTNEPNGVLIYNSGANNGIGQSSDFFAFELLDGHVYLLLNLGSGSVKVKATTRRVDDGHWHTVALKRTGRSGRVTVDESAVDFISPGTSNQLDLEGALILGGLGTQSAQSSKLSHKLPAELWSGSLKYGFVGCVRDLVVNGDAVDIAAFARRQDSGSIRPACHTSSPQCDSQPCMNGGYCIEGWNRFTCDCSLTSFTGPVCAKDATTLSFNGEQYMNIILPEESHTQAEFIHLRFRTMRPNGLILTTAPNDKSMSHLTVSLESSRAKVTINFGEGTKSVHIGQSLNDDQWHSIKIERRGPSIEVKLDKETQMAEITGQLITLHITSIHIGAYVHDIKSQHLTGHYPGKDIPNFVGLMQNFILNGNNYFEMARDGQISNSKVTAKFGKKDRIIHSPVTFKSKNTFIGLPQLKAYSTMNLYFQFKTSESDGLILYNAGKNQDFIAIELVNGHLNYVFNLGDGARKIRSNTRTTLNDNRWHAITIGRPSLRQHTLMVDDMLATVASTGTNFHLDLDGLLYLGGVRPEMYEPLPKIIESRHGFEGCIASLDLNGETLDPSGSDALIPSTLVSSGCAGPVTKCSNTACANRGICVQMWNSYTCDCDMTSYSGPTCADGNESTAYQFGANNGLITFQFPNDKRPDTKNDLLALGFLTTIENAVLVRIDSGSSNDYMELELVDGNALMVYNLGTEDLDIGELSVKVNDGKYHIVRFTRSGQNSTIQVDNHNVMTKTPIGRQLTIFNSHSKVQIGGKKNSIRNSIEKPFQGIISGFVFNGHRLLDMAVEDDSRVTVEGDVQLLMSITKDKTETKSDRQPSIDENNSNSTIVSQNNLQMQQAKGLPGYESDDLIYSGAGSGCFEADDEDDCNRNPEGSGDDLITPVYVSSAKPTTSMPTYFQTSTDRSVDSSKKSCDEDDEDCIEGSGSGERHFQITISSNNEYIPTQTTRIPWLTWEPPTSWPIEKPPIVGGFPIITTTDYDPNVHLPSRPVTTAPVWSRPVYAISGPTRHSTVKPYVPQTGPPVIYEVPAPEIPKTFIKETPKTSGKVPKTTSDRTVMIIGLIAIGLIIVVIIAPIILFFKVKYRTGGTYKIDETKNYQFAPAGGTPPMLGSGLQQSHLINGGHSRTSPTDHHKPLLKMPKKKDLKEWYV